MTNTDPTITAPAPAPTNPRLTIRWLSYRASLTDTRNPGPGQFYDEDLSPLGGPEANRPSGPVLEFWHGFNSTFDDVRSAYYSQLASLLLTGLLDTGIRNIHFCLWPGGERGALSWPFANHRAVKTSEAHALMLAQRSRAGDYNPPSVISHSLGNLIVCRAGQRLAGEIPLTIDSYGYWISLNAAIDNDTLGLGGRYYMSWCDHALVFYSNNDPVLRNLYTISSVGDLGDGKAFDLALGLTGPRGELDGLDIRTANCTGIIDSHGGVRFSFPAARLMNCFLMGDCTQPGILDRDYSKGFPR